MTRPMTEADVLAAATARISRPSAERDAITALVHWRRVEQGGADVLSDEWYDAFQVVRDAADRLIEVDAYRVTEAASEAIVWDIAPPMLVIRESGDVEYADLPCGHRRSDACEACTPDPDAVVFDLPGRTDREADFLAQWRADVAARADEFERGGSL
jgi:hypothetical protein